jgi:AcrR family transcriptional regulator
MKAQETKKALIDALLRLICRDSVAAVSVRDVAREAGVNHGLVHRYFGSKENLVRDAVAQMSARVHEGDRAALSARSFQFLRDNPALPLMVARACLDGPHDVLALAAPTPERLEAIVAPIRAWLARLGLGQEINPHVVNALGTSALLGWFVLRPFLAASYGLPEDADDQVAEIARVIDRLFASA